MNLRHHTFIKTMSLICGLMALAACTDHREGEIQKEGFVYCSEGDPLSFNPQLDTSGTTADATSHQIYDRLIDFELATGRLLPGLASSWRVSRDGLVYTFQLRKGVEFHTTDYFSPTRTFNADDVLFSINRWRSVEHPFHNVSDARYPYFTSLGLNNTIKDVKRINGYRVEITLHQRDSSFLANLATDFAVVLSEEYGETLLSKGAPENIDNFPIGTGPYKFNDYRSNNYIRYTKHDGYWGKVPTQNKLIFDITPKSPIRLAKLLTGECDAIALPSQNELQVIRQREGLEVDETAGLNVGFWAFNTSKPPFDNPEVRRAFAMAINKATLLEAIYAGGASRAKTILPDASWAFQHDAPDINYNPPMARQLLAQNGIEEGFTMNIWAMPVERAYNPNATRMAQLIQQYLQQIGVVANIVSYDWNSFRRRLSEGSHDSVLIGWSADNADPDNFYRPLLSCSAIASGTNRARWCSEDYDKLINAAVGVTDLEQRKALYREANLLLAEEMPIVPIAHAYRYQAYKSSVRGLQINTFGGIRLGKVEKR